jgi:hypothetical protein
MVEECLNAANLLVSKGSTSATVRIQKEVQDLETLYDSVRSDLQRMASELQVYLLKIQKCNNLIQVRCSYNLILRVTGSPVTVIH